MKCKCCDRPAAEDHKECRLHLRLHSRYQMERQEINVANGRCARCRRPLVNSRHCAFHRDWWNAYRRRRWAELGE